MTRVPASIWPRFGPMLTAQPESEGGWRRLPERPAPKPRLNAAVRSLRDRCSGSVQARESSSRRPRAPGAALDRLAAGFIEPLTVLAGGIHDLKLFEDRASNPIFGGEPVEAGHRTLPFLVRQERDR